MRTKVLSIIRTGAAALFLIMAMALPTYAQIVVGGCDDRNQSLKPGSVVTFTDNTSYQEGMYKWQWTVKTKNSAGTKFLKSSKGKYTYTEEGQKLTVQTLSSCKEAYGIGVCFTSWIKSDNGEWQVWESSENWIDIDPESRYTGGPKEKKYLDAPDTITIKVGESKYYEIGMAYWDYLTDAKDLHNTWKAEIGWKNGCYLWLRGMETGTLKLKIKTNSNLSKTITVKVVSKSAKSSGSSKSSKKSNTSKETTSLKVKSKISLKAGKTYKLKPTVKPAGNAVTFTSQDKKIATVDKTTGVVKGRKKGTTVIVVKSGKKTANVTVVVK